MKKLYAQCFIFFLLIGCKPPQKENKEADQIYFFPVSEYIAKDYKEARLSGSLNKIVRINETADSLVIKDTFDVEELQMLEGIDINNPKWVDKYDGDTIYGLYGEADLYRYRSNDPNLPVQLLEVFMESGNIMTIKAITRRSSLINKHEKSILYYPGRGYELTSVQESWNGDTIRLEVEAYIKK